MTSPADAKSLRRALGALPTGVAVVTATGPGGERTGVTVGSFGSLSLDPPLVLFSLQLAAPSLSALRAAGSFAINVLAGGQEQLALRFARPAPDKFAGLAVGAAGNGAPLLPGCAATFECSWHAEYPGGDHAIVVGAVERYSHHAAPPLVFHAGDLCTVDQPLFAELIPFGVPA